MTEQKNIDLSKLSLEDCLNVWKAIRIGTPLATIIKIVTGTVFVMMFLSGSAIAISRYIFPANPISSSKPDKLTQTASHAIEKDGEASENHPDLEKQSAQYHSLEEKNKILEQKNEELTLQLNKKPDSYRCMGYDKEIQTLRGEKETIEKYIQWLLNPPQTREQADAGIYYSAPQLEVFTKQAGEYRKKAIDLQEQIKLVELDRKECKS